MGKVLLHRRTTDLASPRCMLREVTDGQRRSILVPHRGRRAKCKIVAQKKICLSFLFFSLAHFFKQKFVVWTKRCENGWNFEHSNSTHKWIERGILSLSNLINYTYLYESSQYLWIFERIDVENVLFRSFTSWYFIISRVNHFIIHMFAKIIKKRRNGSRSRVPIPFSLSHEHSFCIFHVILNNLINSTTANESLTSRPG